MANHTNEFLKALKEELKREKPERDPRIDRTRGRGIPPSMVLRRITHYYRRSGEEDTWINLASIIYEEWEAENYPPEEPTP